MTAAGKRAWSRAQAKELHPANLESEVPIHVPIWWGSLRELYLGEELIRRLRADATLGIPALDVCQASGWAWQVKSPFADRGAKRVQLLTDGLRTLNAEQRGPRVVFTALEDHLYFTWMVA